MFEQYHTASTLKTELKGHFLRETFPDTKVKGWATCYELREHHRFSRSGTYYPYSYVMFRSNIRI